MASCKDISPHSWQLNENSHEHFNIIAPFRDPIQVLSEEGRVMLTTRFQLLNCHRIYRSVTCSLMCLPKVENGINSGALNYVLIT